jgi:hypothetical protein
MRTLALVVGAVAAMSLATRNAHAFAVDWAPLKPTEDHTYHLSKGYSVDTIAFTVKTPSDITFSGFTTGDTFSDAVGSLLKGNKILDSFNLDSTSSGTDYTVYLKPGSYSFFFDAEATGKDRTLSLDATVTPVPEPQTWALLVAGLGAMGWLGRGRARAGLRA